MMGMLAAVETWISYDHTAKWKRWLGYLDTISKAVSKVDGVTTEIKEPEGLDNKSPLLKISLGYLRNLMLAAKRLAKMSEEPNQG